MEGLLFIPPYMGGVTLLRLCGFLTTKCECGVAEWSCFLLDLFAVCACFGWLLCTFSVCVCVGGLTAARGAFVVVMSLANLRLVVSCLVLSGPPLCM